MINVTIYLVFFEFILNDMFLCKYYIRYYDKQKRILRIDTENSLRDNGGVLTLKLYKYYKRL